MFVSIMFFVPLKSAGKPDVLMYYNYYWYVIFRPSAKKVDTNNNNVTYSIGTQWGGILPHKATNLVFVFWWVDVLVRCEVQNEFICWGIKIWKSVNTFLFSGILWAHRNFVEGQRSSTVLREGKWIPAHRLCSVVSIVCVYVWGCVTPPV